MTDYPNIQQYIIGEDGQLIPQTWDGEPLWSPDTVREYPHLFAPEAFEQMPGQIAINSCPINCHRSRCGQGCDH